MNDNNGKPYLSPPGVKRDGGTGRRPSHVPLLIFVIFILLLAGAGAVLFLLPGGFNKAENSTSLPTVPVQQPPPPPSEQKMAGRRTENDEADKLLETLLALQVQARIENISGWGGELYQKVLETMTGADDYMTEHKYPDAAAAYQKAITDLEILLDSKETVFQTAMEEGYKALTEGDSEEASSQFAIALAIDPAGSEAKKGAGRAESLDTVIGKFREAETLERSGDLNGSEAKFVELLALDSEFLAGRAGLTRVRQRIEEKTFQDEMSNFFQAVEARQLVRAKSSLKLLRTLRDGDEQVIQAGKILAEREEAAQVASLRDQAENLSEAEKWQDALAIYKKILVIAPESLFGVNGQSLAVKRFKLDKTLTDTINQPSRLQDEMQRATAIKLLAYAQQVEPKGPLIASQVDKLEELITYASTPVDVQLESDNSTDVTIYHVGRMGHFFSRQIVLKPGTYTIVGTRMGYRDIRRTVEVAPGSGITRLFIQCEEPI